MTVHRSPVEGDSEKCTHPVSKPEGLLQNDAAALAAEKPEIGP